MNWWSLLVSLLVLFLGSRSQAQLIAKDSISTRNSITAFSADRTGNIFIGLEGGSILKYNEKLDSLVAYNPTRVGNFELIEAWHGFQVFAFNRKFQDFVLLDRFLSRENRYNLGQSGLFFIELATLASDQNLWLFEENTLRLMKYDFRTGEPMLEVYLDPWLENTDHNFAFIREYQNLLFLTDTRSGTYIFDNLGNFLKQLDTGNAQYLSFSGEHCYYVDRNELVRRHLYQEQRQAYPLTGKKNLGVLVHGDNTYLVQKRKLVQVLIPQN